MKVELGVGDCVVLRARPREPDIRGHAFELNGADAWARAGVTLDVARQLVSVSDPKVLRGVHYNDFHAPMRKWMTCVAGGLFEVVVDLRPSSPTLGQTSSFTLWPGDEVYVPEHCGHGFVVLSGVAVAHYRLSGPRVPASERVIYWKSIDAEWPIAEPIQSPVDALAPELDAYLQGRLPAVLGG